MDKALAEELVSAFDRLFGGAHPGVRASHAKGICCEATFTASPEAAALTRAPHMQGSPVRATVRFSHASGDPHSLDVDREARGMAVKFHIGEGTSTDVVGLNQPVFISRTPEDFIEILRLRVPLPETGQPDFDGLIAFMGAHPESQRAAQIFLDAQPLASFLKTEYFAVHAYRFSSSDGTGRFGRYHWVPRLGTELIPYAEAKEFARDYLAEDLRERLLKESATFGLHIQLADSEDDPDDPTQEWPPEQETIVAGDLEIKSVLDDQQGGCEKLLFDPMRLCDGIEPSNDRILLARPHVYAVSGKRRGAE